MSTRRSEESLPSGIRADRVFLFLQRYRSQMTAVRVKTLRCLILLFDALHAAFRETDKAAGLYESQKSEWRLR